MLEQQQEKAMAKVNAELSTDKENKRIDVFLEAVDTDKNGTVDQKEFSDNFEK